MAAPAAAHIMVDEMAARTLKQGRFDALGSTMNSIVDQHIGKRKDHSACFCDTIIEV